MQGLWLGKSPATLLRLVHVPPSTPVSALGALPRTGRPLTPEQHRGDDGSLRVGRTRRKEGAARSTRVLKRQGRASGGFRAFGQFRGGRPGGSRPRRRKCSQGAGAAWWTHTGTRLARTPLSWQSGSSRLGCWAGQGGDLMDGHHRIAKGRSGSPMPTGAIGRPRRRVVRRGISTTPLHEPEGWSGARSLSRRNTGGSSGAL